MNFISTFDELNKLYEEVDVKKDGTRTEDDAKAADNSVEEGVLGTALAVGAGSLVGSAIGNALSEEAEEAAVVEEEPRQLICECEKCGALVIKIETDIVADEESGLVNVEDECQFCEEAKGFKIVGVVAPYEVAEETPVEEVPEETVEAEEIFDEATEEDEDLEELLDVKPSISVGLGLHGGEGNDVSVLSP